MTSPSRLSPDRSRSGLAFVYTSSEGLLEHEEVHQVEENRRPNPLIHEASPYLQRHAHNPVDWYPWGREALERAKREDKPIFLSIGYSACHW
jgi:hypothetical protein